MVINTASALSLASALLLAGCVATSTPGPAPASTSTAAVSEPRQMGNVAVPALADSMDAQLAEREALIAAINRDGRPASGGGFRDSAPTPVTPPGTDVVELNYEQAELRDILTDMADALDITLVIDPTISEVVSMRTAANRPLAYADIWPLMRLLTRQAGVALEEIDNIYYARRAEAALPFGLATPDTLAASSASDILQVTPLRHLSATAASELLVPLLEPEGRVQRIANSQLLAISASASQLRRVNELLRLVDDDPFRNQGIQLYALAMASASELAEELQEVLQLIEGEHPAYQVMALPRINALLVTAPASRGFTEISRWVQLLDADRQEQREQLFRYRVKNLNAIDLATTLSEVFRQDDSADDEPRLSQADLRRQAQDELRMSREAETGNGAEAPPPAPMVAQVAISADLRVSIVADEATNSLLIRATPRDYQQLLATINQLDTVPLQVMINAAIAQITLTDETAFGVDWSRVVETANSSTSLVTGFLPSGNNGSGLGGLLFNRSFLDGAARIDATLEAIAINNDVRLLARPSVTVINNMEGLIRIGAEVPVRLGETTSQFGSTENIQYRPTGIELYITPRINDDGVVNLTIRQELSSLAEGSGINDNPIFQNQEIETTVVVRDGENVVLGGLIQDNNGRLNTGVPILNQVPVFGRLFSYQRNNNERQELFIILRPEIVNLNDRDATQYRDIIGRFERAAEMLQESGF